MTPTRDELLKLLKDFGAPSLFSKNRDEFALLGTEAIERFVDLLCAHQAQAEPKEWAEQEDPQCPSGGEACIDCLCRGECIARPSQAQEPNRPVSGAVDERLREALNDLRVVLQGATPTIDAIHEFGPGDAIERAWLIMHDDVLPLLSRAQQAPAVDDLLQRAHDEIVYLHAAVMRRNGIESDGKNNSVAVELRAILSQPAAAPVSEQTTQEKS